MDSLPDLSQVINSLAESRTVPSAQSPPEVSGIYAIYLRTATSIAGFTGGTDGLIYIGESSNLKQRDFDTHFETGKTGFSTLRRSLGSILKDELSLVAIPRSDGTSDSNTRNYKFDPEGEKRLTLWMAENLDISCYPFARYYERLKDTLIAEIRPVLNLKGWENPDRKEIKRLRAVCADEAKEHR